MLLLECHYDAEAGGNGALDFALSNLSGWRLSGVALTYQAIVRLDEAAEVSGGVFVQRHGNLHEVAMEAEALGPGETWRFRALGLSHVPRHVTDGPKSAFVTVTGGEIIEVRCNGLRPGARAQEHKMPAVAEVETTSRFAVTPWPARAEVEAICDGVPRIVGDGTAAQGLLAWAEALTARVFAGEAGVFSGEGAKTMLRLGEVDGLAEGAYRLEFASGEIVLSAGDEAGRRHGATTLAHLARGAVRHPSQFGFPARGVIEDAPRFGWRGCHLDVARHFMTTDDVMRFADILAWLKVNVLHLHLTDDEAWRVEIGARPALTEIGAWRGPGLPIEPQHGFSARRYGGFYSVRDIGRLIAHADMLGITVVPEIDVPGHALAALTALPELRDPDEEAHSYRSIQGYYNNALNPGVVATRGFLETVFGEVADMFAAPVIHIGGDEVGKGAWMGSPKARALMGREGVADTAGLQSWFLRDVQRIIRGLGRQVAGWDEVSEGGGVDPDGTTLMAWQSSEKIARLSDAGYQVVACPGEAYYLDMAQSPAWAEPGLSWAGEVSPEQCYGFELDDFGRGLAGVQACIWSENLITRELFNHMVFPRLACVAEGAWTPGAEKSWGRFSGQVALLPRL